MAARCLNYRHTFEPGHPEAGQYRCFSSRSRGAQIPVGYPDRLSIYTAPLHFIRDNPSVGFPPSLHRPVRRLSAIASPTRARFRPFLRMPAAPAPACPGEAAFSRHAKPSFPLPVGWPRASSQQTRRSTFRVITGERPSGRISPDVADDLITGNRQTGGCRARIPLTRTV